MEKVKRNLKKIIAVIVAVIMLLLGWLFIKPTPIFPPTPSIAAQSATLRPNATGDESECTAVGDSPNYKCVDEETADEDTTYVQSASNSVTPKTDLYNIPDISVATIINVTVFARVRCTSATYQGYTYIVIKTHGTEYVQSVSKTTTYSTQNYTWTTNPYTGTSWTTEEVNALQIGVKLQSGQYQTSYYPTRCTQVYATVFYEIISILPTNIGTNTTVVNMPCNFHVLWNCSAGLSGFIFQTNNTGQLKNDTWTAWSGSPTLAWSNITKVLNNTFVVIAWQVFVNNTYNVWNSTGLQMFLAVKKELTPTNQTSTSISYAHGLVYYDGYVYACQREPQVGKIAKIKADNYSDQLTVTITHDGTNATGLSDIIEVGGYLWTISYDGYLYKLFPSNLSTVSYALLFEAGQGQALCTDGTYIWALNIYWRIANYSIETGEFYSNQFRVSTDVSHSLIQDGDYLYVTSSNAKGIWKVFKTNLTLASEQDIGHTITDDICQDSTYLYLPIEDYYTISTQGGIIRVNKTDLSYYTTLPVGCGRSYGAFLISDQLTYLDYDNNLIWLFKRPSLEVMSIIRFKNLIANGSINEITLDDTSEYFHITQWQDPVYLLKIPFSETIILTSLSVGWNDFAPWSIDVGKTLGQVNASLNIDGINWTAVGIEYVNGSSVFLVYENGEYIGYDTATVESTSDKFWIYCLEDGDWYHTYP